MAMASFDKKRFAAMKAVSERVMGLGDDPFKWWVTFEEAPWITVRMWPKSETSQSLHRHRLVEMIGTISAPINNPTM